jgi:4-hydroxybenzoate polyprenyltransferase
MDTGMCRAWLRAIRPHQWAKNLLVFVPMILAQVWESQAALNAVMAYVAFSVCASAVYIINDIIDIANDRAHPRKRKRPFAAGELRVPAGLTMAALLAGMAFCIAMWINKECAVLLGIYVTANACYTFWLKSQPVIDVILLSAMYGLRLEMGAAATGVPLSPWLLAFALFFFTSLAFAKRYVELIAVEESRPPSGMGRGYLPGDARLIESVGPASGYVAVLVLALYMNSEQMHSLYGAGRVLWLLCPLVLYWITRVWLLAQRGTLDDDPVVFALRDRNSLIVASLAAAIVGLAVFLNRSEKQLGDHSFNRLNSSSGMARMATMIHRQNHGV